MGCVAGSACPLRMTRMSSETFYALQTARRSAIFSGV